MSIPRLTLPARLALGVATLLTLVMALLPKPPHLPIDRFGDKFEHMLAFLVLTTLAQIALPQLGRWRIAERLSFFGALIEVMQSMPFVHRDCDIRDWLADTLMVVVVTAVFVLRDARRR